MFGSRSGSTSPCLPLRRVARSLAALLLGMVLPAGVLAVTTPVTINLATSVQALPIIMSGQPGCNLPPPPSLFGPGPETYSYGQASVTTGATGNHVLEVVDLVTPAGAPADPAILLYQGAFNPADPATNLVACDDNGTVDVSLPPTFPRLVVSASTTYTVVVIVPEDPAFAPGTSTATLSNALEPTITFADKSIALGAVGESMTATSNSTGTISYAIQNPAVALIDPGTGALTTFGTGSTLVAALQARDAGTYGSGFKEATLTVTSASLTSQTITFANPGAQNFGTSPTLTATSTSSLAVTFTSSTTGVCTITSGGALTFVTTGACTINADQAGDATYSAATQVSQSFSVNAVVPGAPTIGTATAGNAQATVTFTAPASNGGSAIMTYTATSNPAGGTGTCTAPCTSITVTGLTNGTAYTFTVTATNVIGTGSASAASNSVAPSAPPTVVTAVTISASPLIAASATTMNVVFTATTALVAGDTITVKLTGYTFTAGAVTITAGTGLTGVLTGAVIAGALDTVVVTGGIAAAGTSLTFTFPATNPAVAGTIAAAGLTVATSKDTTAVASASGIVITAPSAPTVTDPTSASVTTTAATLGGNVTSDGGAAITERGVVYALTAANANPLIGGTGVTKVTGTGTTGVFTVSATGLTADSGYSFKAYATNSAGTTYTTVVAFTTAPPDFCTPNPCLNGGICTNVPTLLPTTYQCVCPAGFTGSACEIASPSRLSFTTQPTGAAAGVAFTTQPKVAIQDSAGNQTADTDTVSLAIKPNTGATGAVLTCTSTAAVAGEATFSGCKIDKAGTGYVLTASSGTLTSADSTAFAVAAPPATAVTGVTISANPTTAASATTITVGFTPTAALAAGDTITVKLSGYTFAAGAVTVTGGIGVTGSLTGAVAAGALDTVVVTLGTGASATAGTTLRFSLPATNPAAAGTIAKAGLTVATSKDTTPVASASDIVITAAVGAATKLAFTTQPAGAVAGTAFTTQPVVTIQDAGGTTVAIATNTVSLAIKAGGGTGTGSLICTATSLAAVAGVATFSGCKIDKPGTYTLEATSTGLIAAQSTILTVTCPTGTVESGGACVAQGTKKLVFVNTPSFAEVSVGFGARVDLRNADGTTDTSAVVPVTLSLSTATPITATATAVAGIANFRDFGTAAAVGTYTLTASATGYTSATTSIAVQARAGAATKLVFLSPPPATMESGTRFGLSVAVQDAVSVVVLLGRGTVSISAGPNLKGNLTANVVGGVATFTGLYFVGAGSYTLTATSATLTNAVSTIMVTPPTKASYLAFTSGPAFETTGTRFVAQPQVTAFSADGNVFSTFNGTVTLTVAPAAGTTTTASLSPPAALSAIFVSGVASFTGVMATAPSGTYVLTATAGAFSASTTFNVYADTATAQTRRSTEQAQSTTFTLRLSVDASYLNTANLANSVKADLCRAINVALDSSQCARLMVSVVGVPSRASASAKAGPESASAAKETCPVVVTGVGEVTVPPCMYSAPGTYRLEGSSPGFPSRTSNPFTVVDTLAGNLPGAPRNLKVVAGDGQAVVSWDPPETTGASRIVAYEVFGLRDGVADQSLAKGLLNSKTLKLPNGSEWRFGVKALNSLGGGEMTRSNLVRIGAAPAAAKVSGVVEHLDASPGNPPATGAAPKLTTGGCRLQAAETVAVAPDEGPDTGAIMRYGASGLELTDCPAGVANVTISYPGVVEGMQVYSLVSGRWSMLPLGTPGLVVRGDTASFAVADNGPADADPQVGVISLVAGVGYIEAWLPELPGTPQSVTTTPGAGSIAVSWTAPATGGAPVRYRVVAVPGGASCVADAPATSCTVTGLSPGIAYTFTVTAENAAGAGSASVPSVAASPLSAGAAPVPTLGEYARILLALLLLLAVWVNRDRLFVRR